jgi:hypothetical protein
MNEEELKNIMQNDEQTWFTLGNLSKKTNLNESAIQKILKNSNQFVQSSSSKDGENLFTTREEFKEKSSFASRIIGAFKNRID